MFYLGLQRNRNARWVVGHVVLKLLGGDLKQGVGMHWTDWIVRLFGVCLLLHAALDPEAAVNGGLLLDVVV